MSVFFAIRNFQSNRARGALTAATIAWFGFLLQPCAMAASLPGQPHDWSGVEVSVVTHHGPAIPAEQCLHCDGNGDLLPSACDEIVASGKSSVPKLLDIGTSICNAAAPPPSLPDIQRIASGAAGPPQAEDLPPPVAFTEIFCVYLE